MVNLTQYSNAFSVTVKGNSYTVDGSTLTFGLPVRPLNNNPAYLQITVNNTVIPTSDYIYPSPQAQGYYGFDMQTYINNSTIEARVFVEEPETVYNSLVTLPEVKNFLDITSNTFDAKLSNLIIYASSLVESYCGRQFLAANVTTEYHDGGMPYIAVRNPPVNEVYSVAEYDGSQYVTLNAPSYGGGLPNTVGNAANSPGYTVESGSGTIWKGLRTDGLSRGFYPTSQGIRLSYNGGYKVIPADLKLCTLTLVKDLHKGLDDKVIQFDRERLEKMPYSAGFPPHIRRVLDLYRLIV